MLSFKKNYHRIVFILISTLLILITLNLVSSFLNRKQHDTRKFQEATHTNWILVYFDAQLEDYYQEKEKAISLKKEYADLVSPHYFEVQQQPIEVADFSGPVDALVSFEFDGGSSSCFSDFRENTSYDLSAISAIQISENVQDRFQLLMQSGSGLKTDAFDHRDNEKIHVLLGSDYLGAYEIGDEFTGWYLFQRFEFVVDGILAPGSSIQYGYDSFDLNAMIVMPAFNIINTPQNSDEQKFFVRHYSNKLCGVYEYAKLSDADVFQDKCQALSAHKDFSYETYNIALTIEDALLIGPFGLRYFDAYSALLIIAAILSTVLLTLLFHANTQQIHASEVAPGKALRLRFIEFLIVVIFVSIVFYVVIRRLNLHFSLFVFVSSLLALMSATILFARKRHLLNKTRSTT